MLAGTAEHFLRLGVGGAGFSVPRLIIPARGTIPANGLDLDCQRVFVALGGFAGMTKIYELMSCHAKITASLRKSTCLFPPRNDFKDARIIYNGSPNLSRG
jgi:hypothetical protein